MASNSFSSKYMLLNPEDAGFWDVLKLLFSSNIGHRKFVQVPDEDKTEPFAFRWIIFVSVIAQIVLMAFAKPLAISGAVTEFVLNMVTLNGGFFGLMFNIFTVMVRFLYSYDVVTRIPYDDTDLMFTHFGTCVYYNSFYQGKVVVEEPNKNYFSIFWIIPKIINAWWELIRSFGIRYVRGAEYEEGFVLKFMRLVGILVAGVPAHCPQDYVNATRLGSLDVFKSIHQSSKMLKMP